MKLLRQSCLLLASSLALTSMAYASIGQGKISEISMSSNGDIAFLTTERSASVCPDDHWILPNGIESPLYSALLMAAMQDAQVTVVGNDTCDAQSQGELVSAFSFTNNPQNWINANTAFSRALTEKSAVPAELNQLLEELMSTLTLQKEKVYPNLSEGQIDCLLNEVENQLKNSGKFKNIVVPRTHTGDVTFSLKMGGLDFVIHYAHNEETSDLTVTIVKSAVKDELVWEIVEDGMKACVPGAGY